MLYLSPPGENEDDDVAAADLFAGTVEGEILGQPDKAGVVDHPRQYGRQFLHERGIVDRIEVNFHNALKPFLILYSQRLHGTDIAFCVPDSAFFRKGTAIIASAGPGRSSDSLASRPCQGQRSTKVDCCLPETVAASPAESWPNGTASGLPSRVPSAMPCAACAP